MLTNLMKNLKSKKIWKFERQFDLGFSITNELCLDSRFFPKKGLFADGFLGVNPSLSKAQTLRPFNKIFNHY